MVNSSKILTVSYGTFTCTAEGFEDPLAVVKDTTHFFRGVVREDPFFGAEPPQFDADLAGEMMRAQISAEERDGALVLRPAASQSAMAAALQAGPARRDPAPQAEAPAADLPDDSVLEEAAQAAEEAAAALTGDADATAEDTPEIEIAAEVAQDVVEDAPAPQPATSLTDTGEAPETMADRLARIRNVVAGGAATAAAATVAASVAKADEAVDDAPDAAAEAEPRHDPALPETATPAAELTEDAVEDIADALPDAAVDDTFDSSALTAMLSRAQSETPADDAAVEVSDATSQDDSDLLATTVSSAPSETLEHDADNEVSDAIPEAAADSAYDNLVAHSDPAQSPDMDDMLAEIADDTVETWDDAQDSVDALADTASDALMQDPLDALDDMRTDAASALDDDDVDYDAMADTLDLDDAADALDTTRDTLFDNHQADAEPKDLSGDDLAEAAFDAMSHGTGLSAPEASADATPSEPAADAAPVAAATEDDAKRPPVRARVVKVKRAVFEQAVASGQLEEVEDDAPADTSLSAAEEDELARELAAVKAEMASEVDDWDDDAGLDSDAVDAVSEDWADDVAADDAPYDQEVAATSDWDDDWEDETPVAASETETDDLTDTMQDSIGSAVASVRKAVKMSSPGRAMLTERQVEDDDASRILSQTNTELEEPEGNRRRSAIAHLRAAVAATRADRLMGRKPDAEDEAEPYREDLATVVRPRRPQAPASARVDRPVSETERPAPLKLVAEQRVAEATEQADPVRPRRVAMAEETSAADNFTDYANTVGARELPELLEAAAAYMSFVEGRDQFSRPQLMTTVRQAEQVEFSREDRLRSFGQLLREGKIEKTTGGRFTASDRINFKPGRRAAG